MHTGLVFANAICSQPRQGSAATIAVEQACTGRKTAPPWEVTVTVYTRPCPRVGRPTDSHAELARVDINCPISDRTVHVSIWNNDVGCGLGI